MTKHPPIAEIPTLTRLLLARGIEFIVVGGAAAIAHGSPTNTRDFDIVHSRSLTNVERIREFLVEIDAYFRTDFSGRKLLPGADHLTGRGQILLTTRLGPLDLLCQLHDGRGYDELLPHTVTFEVDGHQLRVLDLPTLIEVKTAAGRTKDKLVVAELLTILKRQTEG